MEQLESAISIAMDPLANETLKQQATLFTNSFRMSEHSYEVGLQGYLSNRSENLRFFCLQVLEDTVRNRYSSLSPGHGVILRNALWERIQSGFQEPFYLRNRVLVLVVLLFKEQYPLQWPDFFDQLLPLADSKPEVFLRLCLILDEEVVCAHFTRSQTELAHNVQLKDWMRDHACPRLVDAWFRILFANYSGNELSKLCLQLLGLYVNWIDINLVVRPDFIRALYELLKSPILRVSAADCLSEILGKKMRPSDKIGLFDALQIVSLLPSIQLDAEDPEFDEHVAKLVNFAGLEMTTVYSDSVSTEADKAKALENLKVLFPEMIKLLNNPFDETSSAVFPFVSQYLLVLKKLKKSNPDLVSKDDLLNFLKTVVFKMKYDESEDYKCGPDAGDDEAEFIDMRKTLRTFLESITFLDDELFVQTITQFVCSQFDTLAAGKSSNNLASIMTWSQAELAVQLTYVFAEAKPYRATTAQLLDDSLGSPLGLMMTKMIESDVSSYPHESIPIVYFETVCRYTPYFEKYPQALPQTLAAFIDARGLHHPLKCIRLRIFYLFLRFVKSLKSLLGQFVPGILSSIQDLLVISLRPVLPALPRDESDSNLSSLTSFDFDSQVHLFEAVGYLISLDAVSQDQQAELLSLVINPLLQKIDKIMQQGASLATPWPQEIVWELSDLITAVGSVSKGFPDYIEKPSRSTPPWAITFQQSLKGIIIVLSKLSEHAEIREAARFSLQRMLGSIGPEVLEHIPAFLSAGLLSTTNPSEISDFLPFISLIVHKFKASLSNILISLWKPLTDKIFYFLNREPSGTDDVVQLMNLKRGFTHLLGIFFGSGLQRVLTAPENSMDLNRTLLWLCQSIRTSNDPTFMKSGFVLCTKMILSWGGSSIPSSPTTKRGMVGAVPFGKEAILRDPLVGFDQFIFEQFVPLMFQVCLNPSFKIDDGQTILALSELAGMNKSLLDILDTSYLTFLSNVFLPSIGLQEPFISQFVSAVQQYDRKALRNYLIEFVKWAKSTGQLKA